MLLMLRSRVPPSGGLNTLDWLRSTYYRVKTYTLCAYRLIFRAVSEIWFWDWDIVKNIVISAFGDEGYHLADECLLNGVDRISDLDFILGSNAAYCFHDYCKRFPKIDETLLVHSTKYIGDLLPICLHVSKNQRRVSEVYVYFDRGNLLAVRA